MALLGGCASDVVACGVGCSPSPSWQLATEQSVGAGARGIVVTDCNGDDHADIVVANSASATISVLKGHGDGSFAAQETFSAGPKPWMLALGDFDGDGVKDLVVANFVNGASVMMGYGNCAFSPATNILPPAPSGMYSTAALAVAARDLDGDGHDDIIAQATGPMGVASFFAVLYGKGAAIFEPAVMIPVKSPTSEIVVADFNSDNIPDIAGAQSSSREVPAPMPL